MTITRLNGEPAHIGDQVVDITGKTWTLKSVTFDGMVLLEGDDKPYHPAIVGLTVTP